MTEHLSLVVECSKTFRLDTTLSVQGIEDMHASAYAAFIVELSYLAINNLPLRNSSRSYLIRSIIKQRLFISRMPDFWLNYLLGITDCKSSWC